MNDDNPNLHDDLHGNPNEDANPQHELASAFLDGAVSVDERARVDSSAVLRSLVDSFEQIRSELADVPPAPAATRDAAFAAAFAEFDAAHRPAQQVPAAALPAAASVTSLSSRRRWARPLLSAAAAILLVGVVGVAIMNGDDDDTQMSTATDAPADRELASSAADTQSATEAAAPVSTIGSITGGGEVATIIDTPEALQALPLPAGANTMPATATVVEDTADTAAASETTVAADTTAKIAGGTPVTGALACLTDQQVFLADIMYQGTFAVAARDTVTGVTQAIADDCTVLATVGP
jgi:negative regulator of sigma E activity